MYSIVVVNDSEVILTYTRYSVCISSNEDVCTYVCTCCEKFDIKPLCQSSKFISTVSFS